MFYKRNAILFHLIVLMFINHSPIIKANPMEIKTQTIEKKDIFQNIKRKIKKYTLDNGLKIIFMQNGTNPTVALYWKILAGSSDETPETAGIAHMLEHMLFKGTQKVGTIDFEKEKKYLDVLDRWYHKLDQLNDKLQENLKEDEKKSIEQKIKKLQNRIQILENEVKRFQISEEDSIIYSIHGQTGYNAYTSEDVTNYQIELPSNRIEVWARLESDRIKHSVFREFYTERNVVAEERRMRVENNPFGYLYEKFISEIYKNHPYGYPTIGPMENILRFKKEQAIQYYKNYYRPDNTVIAVVGNFDEEETLNIIKKYFGDWERPLHPIPRNQVQKLTYRKVDLEIVKEGSPIMMLAWKKPNFPAKEDLIFNILSDVLIGRPDTRFHKKLIEQQKLVSQMSIYSAIPGDRYENLFLMLIYPNISTIQGKDKKELEHLFQSIETSIIEELNSIKNHGLNPKELKRVKEIYLTNFIKKMRSNAYLADILTYYELLYGDYHIVFDYYNQIDSITVEDVQKAIQEFLREDLIYKAKLYPEK